MLISYSASKSWHLAEDLRWKIDCQISCELRFREPPVFNGAADEIEGSTFARRMHYWRILIWLLMGMVTGRRSDLRLWGKRRWARSESYIQYCHISVPYFCEAAVAAGYAPFLDLSIVANRGFSFVYDIANIFNLIRLCQRQKFNSSEQYKNQIESQVGLFPAQQ